MRSSVIFSLTVIGVPLYVAFGCFVGKVLGGASAIQRKEGYAEEFSPAGLTSEKKQEVVSFPHQQLA